MRLIHLPPEFMTRFCLVWWKLRDKNFFTLTHKISSIKKVKNVHVSFIKFENYIGPFILCICLSVCLLFYAPTREYIAYIRDVTIDDQGLDIYRPIYAFHLIGLSLVCERGGDFIVPNLLWHMTSIFEVSSEGSICRFLRQTRGTGDLF